MEHGIICVHSEETELWNFPSVIFLSLKQALLLFFCERSCCTEWQSSNSNNDCSVCVCVFITASEVSLILKQAAVWKSLLKLQTCTQTQYMRDKKESERQRNRKSQTTDASFFLWCGWRAASMSYKTTKVRRKKEKKKMNRDKSNLG